MKEDVASAEWELFLYAIKFGFSNPINRLISEKVWLNTELNPTEEKLILSTYLPFKALIKKLIVSTISFQPGF